MTRHHEVVDRYTRAMDAPRLAGYCCLVVGLGLTGGCAGSPPTAADGVPPDFSVAITVYSPQDDPTLATGLSRPFRPGRYIVEADGTLRGIVSVGATPLLYPAPAVRLGPTGQARVWALVQAAGLTRIDHPAMQRSEEAYAPLFDQTVAVVSVQHDGRRETTAVALDDGSADAQAALLLIDELAALSYIRP